MPASDAQRKAIRKYNTANTRQVGFNFSLKYDADILAKLDSVPNKQGYIKDLIRADIARSAQNKGEKEMKIQFEAGEGRNFSGAANYLISEDGSIYAECLVPEGASEDYGYLTMKQAILDSYTGRDSLIFWYDGQEQHLNPDASAKTKVYLDIEPSDKD